MEPQVNRDTVTVTPQEPVESVRAVDQTPEYATVVASASAARHVDRVESFSTVAPHAVAAGILAIAMLVWGGVAMVRAGFDDPIRLPIVSVAGFAGNAVSGLVVAAAGLILLLAAVSRDRGAILFVSIVTGVAALIAAMEPGMSDNLFGIDADLPTVLAICCAAVVLIAAVLPTINRSSHTIERT